MKQQAYGRNVGLLRNARGNGGLNFEFAVESSSTTSLWGKNAIYSEDTCSNSNTVRQNWAATQICFVLTMEESKQEKVPLMTSVWHLMICERAAVACAKRRDALCFVQFKLEQASVLAVKTCAKILREGSDLANTLLLQALLDIHQSKPMRVIMKKTCRTRTPEKDRWKKDSQKGPYAHLKKRWGHCRSPVNSVYRSERSHTTICRELLEWLIILSSMMTLVIVTSITNKLWCWDSGRQEYK